jgi:hypothetical protein
LGNNLRITKNHRNFLVSEKTFYGLNSRNRLNEYSKPQNLITSAETTPKQSGLRSEISKFSGWVTVDEIKGIKRKNAPETEIGK